MDSYLINLAERYAPNRVRALPQASLVSCALVYVARYQANSNTPISKDACLLSLIAAAKFLCDTATPNSAWAARIGYPPAKIHTMEIEFYAVLEFKLFVSPDLVGFILKSLGSRARWRGALPYLASPTRSLVNSNPSPTVDARLPSTIAPSALHTLCSTAAGGHNLSNIHNNVNGSSSSNVHRPLATTSTTTTTTTTTTTAPVPAATYVSYANRQQPVLIHQAVPRSSSSNSTGGATRSNVSNVSNVSSHSNGGGSMATTIQGTTIQLPHGAGEGRIVIDPATNTPYYAVPLASASVAAAATVPTTSTTTYYVRQPAQNQQQQVQVQQQQQQQQQGSALMRQRSITPVCASQQVFYTGCVATPSAPTPTAVTATTPAPAYYVAPGGRGPVTTVSRSSASTAATSRLRNSSPITPDSSAPMPASAAYPPHQFVGYAVTASHQNQSQNQQQSMSVLAAAAAAVSSADSTASTASSSTMYYAAVPTATPATTTNNNNCGSSSGSGSGNGSSPVGYPPSFFVIGEPANVSSSGATATTAATSGPAHYYASTKRSYEAAASGWTDGAVYELSAPDSSAVYEEAATAKRQCRRSSPIYNGSYYAAPTGFNQTSPVRRSDVDLLRA